MAGFRSVASFVLLSSLFAFGAGLKSGLVTIDESNWRQVLDGEWMVEFYAPWCPACKSLQSTWEHFAGWGPDLGIKVAQCDVTKAPGLSGRFLVTALPTIYHVKDGVFRQYQGSRDKDSFISFVEDKKWEKVEEVPFWQNPGSFHMTVVSEFFRFSNYLRDLHKTLVEDWGISAWGSYAMFGVATIIVGALLGLLLVCVMDFLNPPKPMESLIPEEGGDVKKEQSETESSKDQSQDEEEEEGDEVTEENGTEEEEDQEEEEDEATTGGPSGDSQPRRRARRAD